MIEHVEQSQGQIVFKDNLFQRILHHINVSETITAKVICDSIPGKGISCYYISFFSQKPQQLEFQLNAYLERGHYGILSGETIDEYMLWMPVLPVVRHYNDKRHIHDAGQLPSQQIETDVYFRGELPGGRNASIDMTVLQFKKNRKSFYHEITNTNRIETRTVVRNNWFMFSGIEDTWKYLKQGEIYNTENPGYQFGWPAQNLAFTLFYYLDFLHTQTGKVIYRILSDLIAYSLLVSLPPDHRWRNGTWTDLNETHCRHQASGIFVMLSYYQRTQNLVFIEKAELASAALFALQDDLSTDAIWFLHDSLELSVEASDLFYTRHRHTDAFGKSPSNTLCLNTHMWTQILLLQLYSNTKKEEYRWLLQKSMNALRRVLTHDPLGVVYGPAYSIRDFLMNCSIKTNSAVLFKLSAKYEKLLRDRALPFLKRRCPRLIMPNGFSERDLDASSLSNPYHLLNVKDMLMLYWQTNEQWLKAIIQKTLGHLSRSSQVKWVDRGGRTATIVLDIYLLAAGLLGDEFIKEFVGWLTYFHDKGTPITMDILANPMVCGSPRCMRKEDVSILQFSLPSTENSRILFVNLGQVEKPLNISKYFSPQTLQFIKDMNGDVIEVGTDMKRNICPFEWLVAVIKND
jgi:hypothetical protein